MKLNNILILSIIVLSSFFFCHYSLSAQQLKFDELIIGNIEEKPDTLKLINNLNKYFSLYNQEEIKYIPYLNNVISSQKLSSDNNYGYFFLMANTKQDINSRFLIHNPKMKELNFYMSYYLKKYYNDFKTQKLNLVWQPEKNYSTFKISPLLGIKFFEYHNQKSLNINSNVDKREITNLNFQILSKPENVILIDKLNTNLNYYYSKKLGTTNKNNHNVEFDLFLQTSKLNISDNFECTVSYLHNNVELNSNLHLNTSPIIKTLFDDFALHFQISEYAIPSLLFEKSINLNINSQVIINNKPKISKLSKIDFYNYFPYANGNLINYSEQTPLNAKLFYNLSSPIHIQIGGAARVSKNYKYIGILNNNFYWLKSDIQKFGIFVNSSIIINKFELSSNTHLFDSKLKPNNRLLSDIKIPWVAHIDHTSEIAYNTKRFRSGINLSALFKRYDLNENDINNIFVLNQSNSFRIHPRLTLNLDFKNLLNQKYYSNGQGTQLLDFVPAGDDFQPNLPKEKASIELSFIWYF